MATSYPYFPFYAGDWLADEAVNMMTESEEGVFVRLLSICWREGSIPADPAKLQSLKKDRSTPVPEIVLSRFRVSEENPMRMVHLRLEIERAACGAKSKQASRAAKESVKKRKEALKQITNPTLAHAKRARNGRSTDAQRAFDQSDSDSETPTELNTETPTESCPAVSVSETLDTSPPALTFPTQGKPRAWNLTTDRLAKWEELYPALDVEHECRKALDWIESNRPKTAKGMPAFLSRWLSRAADRPGGEIAGQREPPGAMRGWRDEPIPPHTLTEEQSRIMLGDD